MTSSLAALASQWPAPRRHSRRRNILRENRGPEARAKRFIRFREVGLEQLARAHDVLVLAPKTSTGESEQRLPHSNWGGCSCFRRETVAIRTEPSIELSLGGLGHPVRDVVVAAESFRDS